MVNEELGRVFGQTMIEQASQELLDLLSLFVDDVDNKEQIIEFLDKLTGAGGSLYKLTGSFPEDQLASVAAHLAASLVSGVVSIFVPAPVPKEGALPDDEPVVDDEEDD